MAASGGAPVCLGTFFRLHCRHGRLFESEYKRSNRNRGKKILRCFPHCCPSHVERSYCGSSLQLDIEMHQPLVVDATTLFVFARFETVDLEDAPVIEDRISLQHLQGLSKNGTQPGAQWTQGVLQPSSTVFVLNGQTSSKWYYHWESGANKARRLTKHVLKAYILYRRPRGGVRDDMLQVIGIASSPPFTLVSYRRAWEGLEGMADGMGESAAMQSNDRTHSHDLRHVVRGQISQASSDYLHNTHDGDVSARGNPRNSGQWPRSQQNEQSEDFPEEPHHWIWERDHATRLRPVKDLAVIYFFVSRTPMAFAMQSSATRDGVCAALQEYCMQETDPRDRFQSRDLLSQLFHRHREAHSTASSSSSGSSRPDTKTNSTMNAQVESLLVIVAKLSIWMLSDENVQLFQTFFDSSARHLLHKQRLRDAYLRFVDLLWKRVEVFWSQEVTASESASLQSDPPPAANALHALSEHILALSHVDASFQWMWPGFREILESPASPLWESFIAQVRETFVRQQPKRTRSVTNEATKQLSGCWRLDAISTDESLPDESISTSILGIFQLHYVSVHVIGDGTLHIGGAASLLPQENHWMALVCDDTPRIASVLPLGLSTLLGFQVSGIDYIGTMNEKQSRAQLELYWWPAQPTTTRRARARATRMVLTLQRHAQQTSVRVTMEVHHADMGVEELQQLGCAKERVGLRVEWAHAWQATGRYVDAGI